VTLSPEQPSAARWFHAATSYPPGPDTFGATLGRPAGTVVALPRPRVLDCPLEEAIAGRASCRRFSTEPLLLADVSTLLHAAYGVRGEVFVGGFGFQARPVPSAGAVYPLGLHVVALSVAGIAPGIYRYLPAPHALEGAPARLSRNFLSGLLLGQHHAAAAGVLAVVTARLDATLVRYGDRGYRYVLLEAGHVGQNLDLASSALGLGALDLGGFLDRMLGETLRLTDEVPIYGVALGHPSAENGDDVRQVPGGFATQDL
jgi:SagB-type dehydrogenase family enzyme